MVLHILVSFHINILNNDTHMTDIFQEGKIRNIMMLYLQMIYTYPPI